MTAGVSCSFVGGNNAIPGLWEKTEQFVLNKSKKYLTPANLQNKIQFTEENQQVPNNIEIWWSVITKAKQRDINRDMEMLPTIPHLQPLIPPSQPPPARKRETSFRNNIQKMKISLNWLVMACKNT